ncbi:MAG: ATP-binding cassette domain-containing protein [Deltaproteobacteria bacterium]
MISARGLTLKRGGRLVLDHVDVDIHPGEIVTLIGPNGSGKTSLVRALLGVQDLTGGEISKVDGLKIGYVPQRFDIDRALPMTVSRFLCLGHRMSRQALLAVLSEVGAARCIDQQLSELSGGELQRVLLARALVTDPDLLVLDEPVRGVDYNGEADLYALIGELRAKRGIGVLLVSHDLHVVMAQSDRVLCLNRHICCSGVPETVAQHPEYMRLFGPDTARAFGVYRHHHDHAHGLDGRELPVTGHDHDGAP